LVAFVLAALVPAFADTRTVMGAALIGVQAPAAHATFTVVVDERAPIRISRDRSMLRAVRIPRLHR